MRRITISGVRKRVSGAARAAIAAAKSPNGVATFAPAGSRPESFAAGLNRWIARYTGKNRTSYPPSWRHQLSGFRAQPAARVAVVMHVYYVELLEELLEQLRAIPVPFDLLITNATGSPLSVADVGQASTHCFDVPNRGRDILPMVLLVNAGTLDRYELVLKVHTKKSEWRAAHELEGSGDAWRTGFIDGLLGSAGNISAILDGFADDPNLGILTSNGNVLDAEYWGGDRAITGSLLRRLEMDLDDRELQFAAGSMYWIRAFVLQGLVALHLSPEDFEPEQGQVDGTTAHAIERLIGVLARETGYEILERRGLDEATGTGIDYWDNAVRVERARVIPFYLPQFHTFAENNLWWGEGFTEWSNVASAQPVFRGHTQPLLPSALGFYDLLSPETRPRQYAEARAAGIEGFMYYYYWFAGRKLMDAPVEALHASDDAHPFCLMWANENWSRRWDGSSSDILIGQDYEHVPTEQFIEDVAHLLRDPRYIRVDGRPVIAVYRISQIPDFQKVIESWRRSARDNGIGELHILTVDVGVGMDGLSGDPRDFGLDGNLEFPPHNTHWAFQPRKEIYPDPRFDGRIMSYEVMVRTQETKLLEGLPSWRNPGVMVGFDNTARRQWKQDIWYGSNPYTFRRWIDSALSALADRDPEHRILFINAWNEWAESAVLEPSVRSGRSYLLAVRDALMR